MWKYVELISERLFREECWTVSWRDGIRGKVLGFWLRISQVLQAIDEFQDTHPDFESPWLHKLSYADTDLLC